MPWVGPQLPPSGLLASLIYSLIIPPCDALQSELLTALLNELQLNVNRSRLEVSSGISVCSVFVFCNKCAANILANGKNTIDD